MKTRNASCPAALAGPLDRLASLGLVCPPHWPVSRFLDLLVSEGVLSAAAARSYLEVHSEVVYGTAPVEAHRVAEAARSVLRELEPEATRDSAMLTRLAAALTPMPPPVSAAVPGSTPSPALSSGNATVDPPAVTAATQVAHPGDVEPAPRKKTPHLARRRLALRAALLLWSAVMVGLGCLGRPLLARVVAEVQVRVFGTSQLVPPELRLSAAREQAVAQPDARQPWLAYANLAEAAEHYGEAVLALRHLLARQADDPEVLNRLAWLYCTATDPAARDPRQALELAERAYALSQEPHITDTLAEAAFQNGDRERAVALEEDALHRTRVNRVFYRRQLARFKAAAGG